MEASRRWWCSLFLQYKTVIFLVAILVLGAFLRLYHLSDWVHFELDQARDAKVVVSALENGMGELPLLGPRAGGTFLRLGPGFYIMEYLGALVFGGSPWGLTMPITLLSIASIVVFFFLLRRIFSTALTLGLTALFAVSSFMVLYGRFAWNPNPLPFFLMAGFLALLKSVDGTTIRPSRWLFLATFLLGFATHLHFLAFVALPVIVGVFLLWKRPRFSWRAWIVVFGIILILYVPVILNDTMTDGAEVTEFLEAVQGKSNKSNHTLPEQFVRNTTNYAAGFWVILTGYEESAMGKLVSKENSWSFELICDNDCHKHIVSAGFAMMIMLIGGMVFIQRWYREKRPVVQDAIVLFALWFSVCFLLFMPLSYDFSPRFFLLIAPFPFLFLGLIFDALYQYRFFSATEMRKYFVRGFISAVLVACIASNLYFLTDRFDQLRRAPLENFATLPDRILKEKTRFTSEQQNMVLDYLQIFQQENSFPIYMFSEPEYRRALKYLMERRGMRNDVLGYANGIYANGNYFLIIRTGSNHTNSLKKYLVAYELIEEKQIGTITVFRLQPNPEAITAETQVFDDSPKSSSSAPGVPERYTWSEWWNHRSGTADDEATDESLIEE